MSNISFRKCYKTLKKLKLKMFRENGEYNLLNYLVEKRIYYKSLKQEKNKKKIPQKIKRSRTYRIRRDP